MAGDQIDTGGCTFHMEKPLVESKTPIARGGMSCIYANQKLVSFGGNYFESDDKFTYLNETWLFDVESLEWHKIKCTGEIPGPRYGHCAHILGSKMFVFGGKGPGETVYKDCFCLDLLEWIWIAVKAISNVPFARFGHASEVVGKKIVIHGGWNGKEVFDDLWIFNTETYSWSQPKTTGFGPSRRYGHTLTLTPNGRLLVFGGAQLDEDTGVPKYLNDLRQLDTDTMIWTRPRINGDVPTGRFGHSSTLLNDGKIAIFGGWGKGGCQSNEIIKDIRAHSLHILDTKAPILTFFTPKKTGNKEVKHLHDHGACRSTGINGNSIFIFGGWDGRQACGDFYILNIEDSL